jgi:hypothetical protein
MTTRMTARRRFAMPILEAERTGTAWAAAGAGRRTCLRWLREMGYGAAGITAKRVLRAYDEQIRRG